MTKKQEKRDSTNIFDKFKTKVEKMRRLSSHYYVC